VVGCAGFVSAEIKSISKPFSFPNKTYLQVKVYLSTMGYIRWNIACKRNIDKAYSDLV
jgi:hypothetical protein